jgi:hypothetical protein
LFSAPIAQWGSSTAFCTITTLPKSCIIHVNWNWETFSSNLAKIWMWNSSQKRYQGFQLHVKKKAVLNNWPAIMFYVQYISVFSVMRQIKLFQIMPQFVQLQGV